MSHYHSGYEDGEAVMRGERQPSNPERMINSGYRHGYQDAIADETVRREAEKAKREQGQQ